MSAPHDAVTPATLPNLMDARAQAVVIGELPASADPGFMTVRHALKLAQATAADPLEVTLGGAPYLLALDADDVISVQTHDGDAVEASSLWLADASATEQVRVAILNRLLHRTQEDIRVLVDCAQTLQQADLLPKSDVALADERRVKRSLQKSIKQAVGGAGSLADFCGVLNDLREKRQLIEQLHNSTADDLAMKLLEHMPAGVGLRVPGCGHVFRAQTAQQAYEILRGPGVRKIVRLPQCALVIGERRLGVSPEHIRDHKGRIRAQLVPDAMTAERRLAARVLLRNWDALNNAVDSYYDVQAQLGVEPPAPVAVDAGQFLDAEQGRWWRGRPRIPTLGYSSDQTSGEPVIVAEHPVAESSAAKGELVRVYVGSGSIDARVVGRASDLVRDRKVVQVELREPATSTPNYFGSVLDYAEDSLAIDPRQNLRDDIKRLRAERERLRHDAAATQEVAIYWQDRLDRLAAVMNDRSRSLTRSQSERAVEQLDVIRQEIAKVVKRYDEVAAELDGVKRALLERELQMQEVTRRIERASQPKSGSPEALVTFGIGSDGELAVRGVLGASTAGAGSGTQIKHSIVQAAEGRKLAEEKIAQLEARRRELEVERQAKLRIVEVTTQLNRGLKQEAYDRVRPGHRPRETKEMRKATEAMLDAGVAYQEVSAALSEVARELAEQREAETQLRTLNKALLKGLAEAEKKQQGIATRNVTLDPPEPDRAKASPPPQRGLE